MSQQDGRYPGILHTGGGISQSQEVTFLVYMSQGQMSQWTFSPGRMVTVAFFGWNFRQGGGGGLFSLYTLKLKDKVT